LLLAMTATLQGRVTKPWDAHSKAVVGHADSAGRTEEAQCGQNHLLCHHGGLNCLHLGQRHLWRKHLRHIVQDARLGLRRNQVCGLWVLSNAKMVSIFLGPNMREYRKDAPTLYTALSALSDAPWRQTYIAAATTRTVSIAKVPAVTASHIGNIITQLSSFSREEYY
jgi:hypothetical protein